MFLGSNLIHWRSKKQPIVARASAKSKFRTMTQDNCKPLWLRIVLTDLKIKIKDTMMLCYDNKASMYITQTWSIMIHDHIKHVEINGQVIGEKLETSQECIPYVSSSKQMSDIL